MTFGDKEKTEKKKKGFLFLFIHLSGDFFVFVKSKFIFSLLLLFVRYFCLLRKQIKKKFEVSKYNCNNNGGR
jgi:hypothetical protein